ncbi:phosphoribosylformimino-5-aminoimidazole carboxamide ribotide isomerase [Puccinia graminis f. sp. tritici CRL 75-36-700-3]|uniref:1-(5-phosphoribosyl)-5-[(5-phosphoribosylamino)methylideneamino] imidazole-4-carboxamide isomerase n=1 Tax=Puccinia graminis f. sp. tritici (strain CRL 75-36-700-3 / race SCCL) TaxID=418459 RepID=E3KTC9_PUCGT|nr:phosphoribosylformimino-5-aminoimidazole carboxamide ribotide isomerase [Puccinia graminis f. sp. tritici CRL 75-36-700-3]EFP87554.1 phosphoribosylformimino-5-aminoimidazole carboxamide ribotide isomerase [Puccinia graminis f. sp. tritici CRL 75-36-700-3]
MTLFRACLDLHAGQVKQIVGGSLDLREPDKLKTNFESSQPIKYYTDLYRQHDLTGTHLIKLGPANDEVARRGLDSWRGQIQVGGGINLENAQDWLDAGASKVIVTSYLFPDQKLDTNRLRKLTERIGKNQLVIDLSCKRVHSSWMVAMNQWTTLTDTEVNQETLDELSESCSEFLVHAADYEGLCQGIDTELIQRLAEWSRIPVTYAGGAKAASDLDLVDSLSNGKVDLTFGSSLDIFGGKLVKFDDLVKWNHLQKTKMAATT